MQLRELVISRHAAERMCERYFNTKEPNQKQLDFMKQLIHDDMDEYSQKVYTLENGSYILHDYDMIATVSNMKVTTVKELDLRDNTPRLNGGITKSGNKYAKKTNKTVHEIRR